MKLVENTQICAGFVPVNMATANNTGDWISMKNWGHLAIVIFKGAGAAAEPLTVTVSQATAVAGTNSKALNFTDLYTKAGADIFAIGTWTRVTQSAGNTWAAGSGANGDYQAIYLIEIDAEDLDVGGGFDCVQASIADVGTTSQVGGILYILTEPRVSNPASPPSAIVD